MIVDIVLAVLIVVAAAFYVGEVRKNYAAGLHSKFEAICWGVFFTFFGGVGLVALISFAVGAF